MNTLVLGLGNPVLSDDAVGLRVVQWLLPRLRDRPGVHLAEDVWGGLRLMEHMVGYQRAILIDALVSGAPPGTVTILMSDLIPTRRSVSVHDLNLTSALALGRRLGLDLPAENGIRLVTIEAADVTRFGARCTPVVEAAIEAAARTVLRLLDDWS